VKFQVLGPLAVTAAGGEMPVGPYKQRSLLALLLIHRNEVVSVDRIIDDLWGDDPSLDRKNSLHVYLSNLRKVLEPERQRRSEGEVLLTRSPGYVLVCEPGQVDVDEFEAQIAEGRRLIRTDPAAASIVLGEALAMWNGRPFEEFTYERWAQDEIERLNELRIHAVESRIEADLDRGLAAELVSELGSLVREHPLREGLTAQLMLAMFRSGRQAEALRAYQGLVEALADELGITPSSELRRLEERMVMGDPALVNATTPEETPGSGFRTVRGYELRDTISETGITSTYRAYQPAVGRIVAVKVIGPQLADDPDFVRSFEDDARRISTLRSDHIVPLYDYWREPGAAYIVERLMLGGSLADRLAMGPMDAVSAARFVEQVGDGLSVAHRAGIAHGDVRAGNVLLDSDGNALLSDFCIALEARSCRSRGTTVEVLDHFAADQQGLAVVVAQAIAGREGTVPELLIGMDPGLAAVLSRATSPDPRDRFPDITVFVDAVLMHIEGDRSRPHSEEVVNPYKGLRAFEQTDAQDFFGREREIERLVGRLGDPSRSGRFVAVVGPSGSGKSSLVKAGLVPALRRGAVSGSESWFIVEMVPGRYPFEALENALLGVAFRPPASILRTLTSDQGIARTVDRILPDDASHLVIVIDQLEELFTHGDPATASRFLSSVAQSVEGSGRVRIVCTLRADFYDRPLLHPTFGELLRRGTEAITPMSPTGLEHAIVGPARRVDVEVDPSLVAEIVADVVERPAALPLMEYTLTEMFDVREKDVITVSAYREVGGVLGALVQRAESILESLDAPSQSAARQTFLRLVSLGQNGDQDTRRRTLVSELTAVGEHGESIQNALDVFGHHRLLTFDRDLVTRSPTVEISHEALLREWGRLREWIEGARADVRLQQRLAEAMRDWDDADRGEDFLLGGGLLHQLAAWSQGSTMMLTASEKGFLDASTNREERIAQEERQRTEERNAAVSRSRRRTRMLMAVSGVAVVIALLAVFAWQERREATALAEAATSNEYAARLADQALRQSGSNAQLSMLLALRAADASVGLEYLPISVEEAMHMAFQSARLVYPGDVDDVQTALTPTGTRGYYVLAPDELARALLAELRRGFSADECADFGILGCPSGTDDLVRVDQLPLLVPREPGTLAGTEVSVTYDLLMDGFQVELEAFAERSGIGIVDMSSFESIITGRESLDRPLPIDVQIAPQPAGVRELDRDFGVIDLGSYLDRPTLEDDYQPYLLDLVSEEGRLLAVPISADMKGLVWYPEDRFARLGVTPPKSWDELISLSRTIVDAGEAPWCIGFSAGGGGGGGGGGDGWPGTDWVEDLVMREAGLETYDAWVSHEIPFDDPSIVRAFERLDTILAGEGFLTFRRESVSQIPWWLGFQQMFPDESEGCWMVHGSTFIDIEGIGESEMGFFLLPSSAGDSFASSGSGNYASALTDRPEVRELVRFLVSDAYGQRWALGVGFLSPRQDFDPAHYGPEGDWHADAKREAASIMLAALARDAWRFDASDLMPGPIGSFIEGGWNGAFFTTMIEFANGALTPQEAAAGIEQAWKALDAAGE
jgi:DNA-binding SARP family transcriptional activator/ABC-type glycerol-3-phosphate transport system substrate-binding protein